MIWWAQGLVAFVLVAFIQILGGELTPGMVILDLIFAALICVAAKHERMKEWKKNWRQGQP
jgi:hypothetical protein